MMKRPRILPFPPWWWIAFTICSSPLVGYTVWKLLSDGHPWHGVAIAFAYGHTSMISCLAVSDIMDRCGSWGKPRS